MTNAIKVVDKATDHSSCNRLELNNIAEKLAELAEVLQRLIGYFKLHN